MTRLPAGIVTFLFTDVEKSTELLHRFPAVALSALDRHYALLGGVVDDHHGVVFQTVGDAVRAAFADPADAVRAALEGQRALAQEPWGEIGAVQVRMAVHTGVAEVRDGQYSGASLFKCARLEAVAHGGQVLLTEPVAELVRHRLPAGGSMRSLGSHRLKDFPDPEPIYQLVQPGLPDRFPPLRTVDASPGNIPAELTSFVGRNRESGELVSLLGRVRLVTLTGPGGVGKSRLALHVARQLKGDFEDGVWLADLSRVSQPELVAGEVASALGVREEVGTDIEDTLAEYAGPRRLLLVLDNCEQVVERSASLAARLLRAGPRFTLISTSREPLGVAGESIWRVNSLTAPTAGRAIVPTDTGTFDAVDLFVERARLVSPGFQVDEGGAAAIGEISRRLDGLPLAIELAAAQIGSHSPQEIAEMLGAGSGALTSPVRDAHVRQRTLADSIRWSYELLSETEQMLFARLSVFAGGWDALSARAVCSGDGVEDTEVDRLVSQLVAKSLVLADTSASAARYTMLETIREFAAQLLSESGEAGRRRKQHLAHYADLARRSSGKLESLEQLQWFDRLELDHGNLRAALRFAVEDDSPAAGLDLAVGLWKFWLFRGHVTEARRALSLLLAATKGGLEEVERHLIAEAFRIAGTFAAHDGDLGDAQRHYEKSLTIYRQLQDDRGAADVLNNLGILAGWQRRPEVSERLHREALALRERLGEHVGVATSLNNLALAAHQRGDLAAARARYQEALRASREAAEPWHIANTLLGLGDVTRDAGDPTAAGKAYGESLELHRQIGDGRSLAYLLDGVGRLTYLSGDPAAAVRLAGGAAEIRRRYDVSLPAPEHERLEAWLEDARAVLGAVAAEEAWEEGRRQSLAELLRTAKELTDGYAAQEEETGP